MELVSLIVGALAAGASTGIADAAGAAGKDAYEALRRLVYRRLGGSQRGRVALRGCETEPEVWRAELEQELLRAGEIDDEMVKAARRLIALTDASHTPLGPVVDLSNARGVQVGDHNVQHNHF